MNTKIVPPENARMVPASRDKLVSRLARVAARQCRENTLVMARDPQPFIDALRSRRCRVWTESLEPDSSDGTPFTCALIAIMDPADAKWLSGAIERAWPRLQNRGCLVIAVPNEEADDSVHGGGFSEGDARRYLETLGRPKLIAEQPFAWLLICVEKKRPDAGRGNPRSRLERFEAMARLCRGSVIELGCGPGALAATIHSRGHTVVGVDLNGPKIEQARSSYSGIEFIQADICQPDLLEGRQFDTVMLAEVLEHVPEAVGDRMMQTARRLLRPGGRIIISVPNKNCIPHRNHVRVFDRKKLKSMLSPFGNPRTVATQPFKWLLLYVDLRA